MEKKSNHIRKIAIVGPESTGKSTLTEALAKHFNEPFVTEIARNYVSNLNRPYQLNDIIKMAELQLEEENKLRSKAKQFLFCDTTLLVHKIWASFVFNEIPTKIHQLYHPQNYDLHLLCDIDLPWTFDPLREHPNHREELFELYENDLKISQANYCIIRGKLEQREQNAIQEIKLHFKST